MLQTCIPCASNLGEMVTKWVRVKTNQEYKKEFLFFSRLGFGQCFPY